MSQIFIPLLISPPPHQPSIYKSKSLSKLPGSIKPGGGPDLSHRPEFADSWVNAYSTLHHLLASNRSSLWMTAVLPTSFYLFLPKYTPPT